MAASAAVLLVVADGAANGQEPVRPDQGPPGPRGPRGSPGPQGERGPRGFPGATSAALSFAEPRYEAMAADLRDGMAVEVRNDSPTELRVTVVPFLSGLTTKSAPASPLDVAEVVSISEPQTLRAGATGTFMLRAGPQLGELAPDSFTGSLAAWAPDVASAARVSLALDNRTATTAPEPLAETQTVQAVRWIPFWDRTVQVRGSWLALAASIPAHVNPEQLALPEQRVIGSVSGDKGGVAAIRYARDTKTLPAGVAGLRFEASGFDGPGTYEGSVDLVAADDEAGEVALTVVTKDAIVWPILALIVGILAALRLRRYQGVERLLLQWRRRLAAKQGAHDDAQRALQGATGEWREYDTTASFQQKATAVAALLAKIERESQDAISDEHRVEVDERFAELDAYTATLAGLDERATALAGALTAVETRGPIDTSDVAGTPHPPPPPTFVTAARTGLLAGHVIDVDTLVKRSASMDERAGFATDWLRWHSDASAAFATLRRLDDDERRDNAVKEAGGALFAAWKALWTAPDTVAGRRCGARLEEAIFQVDASVAQVLAPRPEAEISAAPTQPAERAEERRTRTLAFAPSVLALPAAVLVILAVVAVAIVGSVKAGLLAVAIVVLVVALLAGGSLVASRLRGRGIFSSDRLERGDALMTLAAWVVAIVTGLIALYFDKTFGTPTDYLIAALWGLTTTAAVDALTSVLRARRATG